MEEQAAEPAIDLNFTSPSILQDITLEHRATHGVDQEVGATGLTMKEYDDQLKKLTAENFNLKLKVFFMDERITKFEGVHDKDLLRENVDLKVENESKAKEVERITKLNEQSLDAIEQLQRDHQRELEDVTLRLTAEREQAQHRAQQLEAKLRLLDASSDTESGQLKEALELEGSKWREKISNLEIELEKAQKLTEQVQLLNEQKKSEVSGAYEKISLLESSLALREEELAQLKVTYERSCETIRSLLRRSVNDREEKRQLTEQLQLQQKTVEDMKTSLQTMQRIQSKSALESSGNKSPRSAAFGQFAFEDAVKEEMEEMTRQIVSLKSELAQAQTQCIAATDGKAALEKELERFRESQAPLTEACLVLTERLEELAGFLDSLLTDRAGISLNPEQYEAMKHALCKSRELSQQLSLSCCHSRTYADADSSLSRLLQRMSLQACLEGSHESERRESEPLNVVGNDADLSWLSLDFHDEDLGIQDGALDTLEDLATPRGEPSEIPAAEIRQKDKRRSGKTSPRMRLELYASESEAWSEPDRAVSLARMGHLDSTSVTPLRLSKCSSGSSEETLHENKCSVKRTNSEAKRLQTKMKCLEETNRSLRTQLTLLEKKHSILSKLSGESGPELVIEIQQSLRELDSIRDSCAKLREEVGERDRVCDQYRLTISQLEAKQEEITLDYELKLIEAVQEKEMGERKIVELSERLSEAEELRMRLEQQVVQISSKMAESQACENKAKDQVRQAEQHLDSCERLLHDKAEGDRKIRELDEVVSCLKDDAEQWAVVRRRQQEEMAELRRQLAETVRGKAVVEAKVREEGDRIHWMEAKLRELDRALEQCEQETQAKILMETERRVEQRVKELRMEWVPRVHLEQTRCCLEETEGRLQTLQLTLKEQEKVMTTRINQLESEKRETLKLVSNLRLRESELERELTRLANETVRQENAYTLLVKEYSQVTNQKSQLEKEMSQLTNQKLQLEETIRRLERQNDEMRSVCGRNLSSPDLGIESDQGRFSSLEHHQLDDSIEGREGRCHSCDSLNQRLEDTLAELASANQYRKQMERAICRQLHKTHHILKKARINFEGQESDE